MGLPERTASCAPGGSIGGAGPNFASITGATTTGVPCARTAALTSTVVTRQKRDKTRMRASTPTASIPAGETIARGKRAYFERSGELSKDKHAGLPVPTGHLNPLPALNVRRTSNVHRESKTRCARMRWCSYSTPHLK